jgi:hypothetical protein
VACCVLRAAPTRTYFKILILTGLQATHQLLGLLGIIGLIRIDYG